MWVKWKIVEEAEHSKNAHMQSDTGMGFIAIVIFRGVLLLIVPDHSSPCVQDKYRTNNW